MSEKGSLCPGGLEGSGSRENLASSSGVGVGGRGTKQLNVVLSG